MKKVQVYTYSHTHERRKLKGRLSWKYVKIYIFYLKFPYTLPPKKKKKKLGQWRLHWMQQKHFSEKYTEERRSFSSLKCFYGYSSPHFPLYAIQTDCYSIDVYKVFMSSYFPLEFSFCSASKLLICNLAVSFNSIS